MDCAVWTVIIFCVSAASRSRGCVLTDPTNRVQEGSDVRLTCTFSACPGPLDHTVHVTWEFNDTGVVFYYDNQTSPQGPHLEHVGDILAGDFSVLLRSVTPQDAGTYTCLVRPFRSGVIYKNRTLLAVAPRGSGRRIMMNSDPSVPLPLGLILGCCGVGLLVLAAGSMLGTYWRRGRGQWNTSRKNQGTPASTEEKCPHKDKDQDCYMTLQRGKAPPPASKEESIYVTMHGRPVPPGPQAQPSPNRKAIPTEWCAQENPPRVNKENPPSPHPDSSAASCHAVDRSGLS